VFLLRLEACESIAETVAEVLVAGIGGIVAEG